MLEYQQNITSKEKISSKSIPGYPRPHGTGDMDALALSIYEGVKEYTMTSLERVFALVEAVRYIGEAGIPGAIVECGVWKGGSILAAIKTLQAVNDISRQIYLFDTFAGMPKPEECDISAYDESAIETYLKSDPASEGSDWCRSELDYVREVILSSGYWSEQVHFIKGLIHKTIPQFAPQQIALLRLDTDWYQSTKHELNHLYERVSPGGIIIIDDYGYWKGARKAVDEFVASLEKPVFLNRIDDTGRLIVKP